MSASTTDPPYTVVVGVSATSKSPAALSWAAAQASANHGRLIAVRVFKRHAPPDGSEPPRPGSSVAHDPSGQQVQLTADVAEVLGSAHDAECRVVHGGKRKGLLAVARHADLLVIDAPRAPSSSPLLARRIISGATCPVVFMPPALTGALPSGIAKAGRAALRAVGTSGRPGYRPPEHV